MQDDMLLAIIVHVHEVSASAFLSSQGMHAIELKEFPCADTTRTDDTGILQGEGIEI